MLIGRQRERSTGHVARSIRLSAIVDLTRIGNLGHRDRQTDRHTAGSSECTDTKIWPLRSLVNPLPHLTSIVRSGQRRDMKYIQNFSWKSCTKEDLLIFF